MKWVEIYSALEKVEKGNKLITDIKAERAKANNDGRGNRQTYKNEDYY